MLPGWWPWHTRLGNPYYYSDATGEIACNCEPPELIAVADADTYMGATLKAADWAALSTLQKEQALNSAQSALRTLRWCTDEETCCGKQLVPQYTAAAAELALVLFSNRTAVIGAPTQLPAPVVKRQKLDALEREFFDPSVIAQVLPKDSRVNKLSPTVLRLYPWLLDLIGCWVDTQTGGTLIPLFPA